MKSAILVKSPFSHNALFGFIGPPFLRIVAPTSIKPVVLCSAPPDPSMPERRDYLLERPVEADHFARRPGNFAESPEDRMDAFSEILSGVKLSGAVFFNAEFS